jgi:hypothetical protein
MRRGDSSDASTASLYLETYQACGLTNAILWKPMKIQRGGSVIGSASIFYRWSSLGGGGGVVALCSLSLLSGYPVTSFQFLPLRGAVVCCPFFEFAVETDSLTVWATERQYLSDSKFYFVWLRIYKIVVAQILFRWVEH